jgi:DNA-binding NarL/FixJ family response regulator
MIRVLQVDDHRLVREAMREMLSTHADITVIGALSGIEELTAFAGGVPDVILMDYRLLDGSGAQATRLAKARWPRTRVVMVTSMSDDETVLESVQAGADGYLTKDRAMDDVIAAVQAAHAGEVLLPPGVLGGIARRLAADRDEPPLAAALTPRELEVLRHLARGTSTLGIADAMRVSPETIRTHVQAVRRKLGAESKLQAVTIGLRRGLVGTPGDPELDR